MVDAASRARVQRLLSGDVRVDDLRMLFLYARDRCDGRECIQEIGGFVAHHEERTKGLITREVRDWFVTTWFQTSRYGQPPLDNARLPANFPEVLQASFRRTPRTHLRDRAGLRYADAHRLLPSLIGKFAKNNDGTLALTAAHTKVEYELINALMNITARPAFDDDDLFSDFCSTLKSHGLFAKGELSAFSALKPAITIFALSAMHKCVVRLDDVRRATLKVNVDTEFLNVQAPVPAGGPPPRGGGQILISSAVFSTRLSPMDYCKFELLNRDGLDRPLELETPAILLSPLL